MKHFRSLLMAVLFTAFCLQAQSQTQEEMEAWISYMQPGAMHKMMAGWDGNWEMELTQWTHPGAEASKSTASCVTKSILGGRYSETKHTGDFMGATFEGISVLAFDNAKKEFVNTWIDNMGTGIMIMRGTFDAGSQTIDMKGVATDPMTGKDMAVRQTIRIINDKTQQMEMYSMVEGKEFKNMSIMMKKK